MESMKNSYYGVEHVRRAFDLKLAGRTQVEVAREIGIPPQNLSQMVRGAPVTGKVLSWLGFRRVKNLYEKSS